MSTTVILALASAALALAALAVAVLALLSLRRIRAGQLTMVDVVQDARIERRTVQLGRAIGIQFEVLSGLAAGETVVIGKAR